MRTPEADRRSSLGPTLEGPATDTAAALDPGRTSAIAALRYRDFRLFWFGLIVSNSGTWMQMFGQGYLVVQLAVLDGVPHLAPLYLGLVGLARAVPGLAFGLFGGVVADRADRRRLLIVTQSLAATTALILATLTLLGRINIVEVLLLAAINSLIFSFDAPTRQSMVPRLVPERHLMSAIGLNSAAFNGPQLIGPVIGGVIVAAAAVQAGGESVYAIGWLFLINAVTYLAVVGALALMKPMPVEGRREVTVLRSVREGLGYIRRDPVIKWVIVLLGLTALLSRPHIMLLPAAAVEIGADALQLSWMFALSGAGALLGALATASLGNVRRRGIVLLLGALGAAVFVAALGIQRTLLFALPMLTLASFSMMVFMGMANTLLQTRSPDHLRGRVMSVHTMTMMGGMPLGTMLLGSLGTLVGVLESFMLAGTLLAVVSLAVALRAPAVRLAVSTGRHRRAPASVHPPHAPPRTRNGQAAD